jgi:2-polyprenyl-3-methyl-5-hydroxy-6-metoxy-1,4-benzoquinol methylase
MEDRKSHWNDIYQSKQLSEVSWYEPVPETSLSIIANLKLSKDAAIIDIGGGDSLLVDHLLELGYTDLTVMDISPIAIERAKQRLGEKAAMVNWIVCDMLLFESKKKYELWHDRAAFHFLTNAVDQQTYLEKVHQNLQPGGYLILSTFAVSGPEKCSGLQVQQYSENTLPELFSRYFNKLRCFIKDHTTPFQTRQKFIYCSFRNR